jgi:hypothetical protein
LFPQSRQHGVKSYATQELAFSALVEPSSIAIEFRHAVSAVSVARASKIGCPVLHTLYLSLSLTQYRSCLGELIVTVPASCVR